jgi:hypothetical protein
MDLARAVDAERQGQLDIGGAARAGDEGERAGVVEHRRAMLLAQAGEHLAEATHQLIAARHRDVGRRQERSQAWPALATA